MDALYKQIAAAGKAYGANKIILFGSRARGDYRERSDIDIAVYAMPVDNQALFVDRIEQLPTLLDFDVVFVTEKTSPELLNNIAKDGKIIMDKFTEKKDKFENAVSRLQEAIQDYEKFENSSIRDGVIQRFEFCTELAWKAVREYLINEGYTDINSPKAVMKQAYADGIISNENDWIDLLNTRNITSHVYDDETAAEIFNKIQTIYINLFQELSAKLK